MKRFIICVALFVFCLAACEKSRAEEGDPKSPILAFLLGTFVLPGAGQFYNEEFGKGLLFDAGMASGVVMMVVGFDNYGYYSRDAFQETLIVTGFGTTFAFALISIIDAPLSADSINRKHRQKHTDLFGIENDRYALGINLAPAGVGPASRTLPVANMAFHF